MTYATVTVIVDGALESEEEFFDEALMHEFIGHEKAAAIGHGYPTSLYVMWHEHVPDDDCQCAAYLIDHRPFWTNERSGG